MYTVQINLGLPYCINTCRGIVAIRIVVAAGLVGTKCLDSTVQSALSKDRRQKASEK